MKGWYLVPRVPGVKIAGRQQRSLEVTEAYQPARHHCDEQAEGYKLQAGSVARDPNDCSAVVEISVADGGKKRSAMVGRQRSVDTPQTGSRSRSQRSIRRALMLQRHAR